MSNQGLPTICSIFGFHSGVNAVITVCFSYLSRCLYKASAGDVCCDDFLVRSETFTSLNVESKDTTCTVCWSLWLELTLRVIGILSKYSLYLWMGVGGFPLDLSETSLYFSGKFRRRCTRSYTICPPVLSRPLYIYWLARPVIVLMSGWVCLSVSLSLLSLCSFSRAVFVQHKSRDRVQSGSELWKFGENLTGNASIEQIFERARQLLLVADRNVYEVSYILSKYVRWYILLADLLQFYTTKSFGMNTTLQDLIKKTKTCITSVRLDQGDLLSEFKLFWFGFDCY